MNGDTNVAPALAASSAWLAEKHSVTLTMVPSPVSALHALRPSSVSGTLTVDVLGDLGELAAFLQHALVVGRGDLGARPGPARLSQISRDDLP